MPSAVDRGDLVGVLQAVCGPENVLTHPDVLRTYRPDGLAQHRRTPRAVVLPATASEVQRVVRACYEAGVPTVARGAGPGLSGGAPPLEDGVLIVLARMRRILGVDLADARVVAEPGVTDLAISRAVSPTHFWPPGPSSPTVCSLGTNVAENASGVQRFKYGFTTNYVTGLEVVLSDGDVVELRRDAPGYDLLGAFVGSDGALGVATRIEVRVVPVPESIRTLVAFFDDTAAAGDAVDEIVGAGIVPAAIETMDRLAIEAGEPVTNTWLRLDAGAALIVELDGAREECADAFERVLELCRRAGARDLRVALTGEERELIWLARQAAWADTASLTPRLRGEVPGSYRAQPLAQPRIAERL